MWDKLKLCDRTRDQLYVGGVRTRFHSLTWDPSKKTVRRFLEAIDHYRGLIATTTKPITDDEVRDKLLTSLPRDESRWSQAYMWCISHELDLPATITLLEQHEIMPSYIDDDLTEDPVDTSQPSASASVARDNRKRGRDYNKRGRHNSLLPMRVDITCYFYKEEGHL
jgi:hypothetical protein